MGDMFRPRLSHPQKRLTTAKTQGKPL